MSGTRVDYDRIAPSYNRRFVVGGLKGIGVSLCALARTLAAGRILEVGCGTGHWLAGLHSITEQVYGLDLSSGMLGQAQQREVRLRLVRGRASRLPFPDACFDLVYCVNALHHFQRPQVFVSEAWRLLRPGGVLAVAGMDPRVHRGRWYIYDYFPGTYEIDLSRFPSWGTVLGWMAAAGFKQLEWRLAEHVLHHRRGRSVLDDPFLQKDSTSQLALLSDEAYAAGLDRIEAALGVAEAAGETLTFPVDLFIAMLTGRVPGSSARHRSHGVAGDRR